MIKNIIFDLGRVLLNWEPYKYMLETFPKDVADELNGKVFESEDWWLMDKGIFSEEQLWQKKLRELPHLSEYILHMKNKVPELLTPIEENIRLIPRLKQKGFKLYILSNFSEKNFELVYNKYDFFKFFDGMVISSHVKLAKPQKEIYLELIKKYSLKPEESIFVDDKLENVSAAQRLGFKTVHLENHANLAEELHRILKSCDFDVDF